MNIKPKETHRVSSQRKKEGIHFKRETLISRDTILSQSKRRDTFLVLESLRKDTFLLVEKMAIFVQNKVGTHIESKKVAR